MTEGMAVLESADYAKSRQRLIADPIVRAMAVGLNRDKSLSYKALIHEDGTPRMDFMLGANSEYAKRAGHEANAHIGAVAEALLLVLEGKV
jgi:hypothetical protein